MGFLELRQEPGVYSRFTVGYPFETVVCSVKSAHLSRYEGHLRNVNWAWQENTDASGSKCGFRSLFLVRNSDIGIPINFHEESGFKTF